MAVFKRRKNQTVAELEQYYANKKTRSGMAWVMATISLLVTVAVISAIFFGGRWGYRKITKDDKKPDTTSVVAESGSQTNGTVTPTADFPSVVTDQAASTSVPNTGRNTTSQTASTAPSKGSTEIPNTGAGEVLLIAPLMAAIIGYFVSRKRQLNS